MKERNTEVGLYYPDGSFKSQSEIKRDLAYQGELPTVHTPLPTPKDFDYWSTRFRERQTQYNEANREQENHLQVTFQHDTLINLISDDHVGHSSVDYERMDQEARMIVNTPNSYVIMVGDLINGMSWNPGQYEEMEQVPEQVEYMRARVKYFADNDKLLLAIGGDHDLWTKKSGINPYYEFSEQFGVHYMQGVSYMTFMVGDQEYRLAGAHKLPGSSIYNKTHPQNRAEKFGGARGADVIFSGHNHQKGYSMQASHDFPGVARQVHYIALGTYKPTDSWLKKQGYPVQTPQEMYGSAIRLDKDKERITYFNDIVEANQIFARSQDR